MKVGVLLSGGVDSSVAAALLKKQGFSLQAYYLKLWVDEDFAECPWEEDLRFVREVVKVLRIPLKVLSIQDVYFSRVVSDFVRSVRSGLTPNPDIWCNERVKFGFVFEVLNGLVDKLASGHYARVGFRDGFYRLLRSVDDVKDQTYFLSLLSQEQLSRVFFPVGDFSKVEVRRLASEFGLPTHSRKDSQGICFLGKVRFRDFLKRFVGVERGEIRDYSSGELLGFHEGHWFFTAGQRSGLGLGGGPWFVVRKDPVGNVVFVSNNYESLVVERTSFFVRDLHWIAEPPVKQDLLVKVRHGPGFVKARFFRKGSSGRVFLDSLDQGLAPGQYAVFYDGDECLGSGVIDYEG